MARAARRQKAQQSRCAELRAFYLLAARSLRLFPIGKGSLPSLCEKAAGFFSLTEAATGFLLLIENSWNAQLTFEGSQVFVGQFFEKLEKKNFRPPNPTNPKKKISPNPAARSPGARFLARAWAWKAPKSVESVQGGKSAGLHACGGLGHMA